MVMIMCPPAQGNGEGVKISQCDLVMNGLGVHVSDLHALSSHAVAHDPYGLMHPCKRCRSMPFGCSDWPWSRALAEDRRVPWQTCCI